MAAPIDPMAKICGASIAPASISQPAMHAFGFGVHSALTASASSPLDTFSRVSSPSSALNLQSKTQSLSEGLQLASGMSAGLHRSKMAIIRNIG